MLLHKLISAEVPVISLSDDIEYIRSLFFSSGLRQLPVVEAGRYLGLLEQDEIGEHEDEVAELTPQLYEHFRPAISILAHPFEALRVLHEHELTVLPVLLEDGEYAGALSREALVDYLIEASGTDLAGGIIVLEMDPRDYSLAQIARICENEQVMVLGVYTITNPASSKLEVSIKTNSLDLAAVVQALERFEYTVVNTYGDRKIENDIMDRYKLLMNYLNM